MKKTLIAVAIAFLVIGAASAQPFAQRQQFIFGMQGMGQMGGRGMMGGTMFGNQRTIVVEKVTLEGALALVNARVALVQDGKTYYLGIPNFFYGFVDGLKEGAAVKVEGYARAIPGVKDSFQVRVDTLTVAGRTIQVRNAQAGAGQGPGNMGGMMGPMGQNR